MTSGLLGFCYVPPLEHRSANHSVAETLVSCFVFCRFQVGFVASEFVIVKQCVWLQTQDFDKSDQIGAKTCGGNISRA